jgi:hypothetical protein
MGSCETFAEIDDDCVPVDGDDAGMGGARE